MGLLHEAVTWWAARMAELLPPALRDASPAGADALLVTPPAQGLARMVLRRRGRDTDLGALPLDAGLKARLPRKSPAATLLMLPADRLLEREIDLPLAAEADLDRVLGFEMDRLTPFPAADLHWSWQVLARDRGQGGRPGRLRLRLSLVPRAGVAAAVAALTAAGRPPEALLVERPDGARRIPLSPLDEAQRGRSRRRALGAMAAACAVLAVVAAGLPLYRQQRALDDADARIAALRPALAEVEALRRRIAGQGGNDTLAAEAGRVGNALGALATLTAALPDDTWLSALTLRQRRLTLTGQSADAARLIPLLSADPQLREAAFLAPVTRVERSGDRPAGEAFSLRVDLGS